MKHLLTFGVVAILAAGLSSCGSSGDLTKDLGSVVGDFQVLDLASGQVESRTIIADLDTNPAYRSSKMVFRAVNGGSSAVGSDALDFGAQADETPKSSVSLSRYYIGVYEMTRDQWNTFAGTTPWTNSDFASLVGTADGEKPACGMSRDDVSTALNTWNVSRNFALALPSQAQWEFACRGGQSTIFSWGESRSDAVVGNYAVVSETAGGVLGPRVVGERLPNAYGLFDMHGNVWEFTDGDAIRGGSWRDSLPMARSANRKALDQITGHPLVGVRLVLRL